MANFERDLTVTVRRYDRAAKILHAASAERDRVIRDAVGAKLSRQRITAITGLNGKAIDQITRDG